MKTHCCFCGQQCGLQLKVKHERVVGLEPWEDFPFNRGPLCPKGVKRYMQDEHPDRLRTPLERVEGVGFRPVDWDAALDRTAREIRRIQAAYGRDGFALLTGASLTNERAHLMGKFARVALRTANIDYNGRLCMVSAAAASKKILATGGWSRRPTARGRTGASWAIWPRGWGRARSSRSGRRPTSSTSCGAPRGAASPTTTASRGTGSIAGIDYPLRALRRPPAR